MLDVRCLMYDIWDHRRNVYTVQPCSCVPQPILLQDTETRGTWMTTARMVDSGSGNDGGN